MVLLWKRFCSKAEHHTISVFIFDPDSSIGDGIQGVIHLMGKTGRPGHKEHLSFSCTPLLRSFATNARKTATNSRSKQIQRRHGLVTTKERQMIDG
jgi:hypothetical protein